MALLQMVRSVGSFFLGIQVKRKWDVKQGTRTNEIPTYTVFIRSTREYIGQTVILWLALSGVETAKRIEVCRFQQATYKCQHLERSVIHKLSLPSTACVYHDCTHCVRARQTLVLNTENYKLSIPQRFLLQLEKGNDTSTSFYNCTNSQCDCLEKQCNGPADFCARYHCSIQEKCVCALTRETGNIYHISDTVTLKNPPIISFENCIFEKPHRLSRRLLENEQANFHQGNLDFNFTDPILSFSDIGRVILRTSDYEIVLTVPESRQIELPFELLAYKATLSIIFIAPQGITLTGEVQLTGKSVCQISRCIFCMEGFRAIKCWPVALQYALYTLLATLTLVAIWLLKFVLQTTTWFIKSIGTVTYLIYKLLRKFLRLCLLVGAYFGMTIRNIAHRAHRNMENGVYNGMNIPLVIIFILFAVMVPAQGDCSENAIIQSDTEVCEANLAGEKSCRVSTTAEITLNNINHETCLWLQSKDKESLLSLKIKFVRVDCAFQTERQYFTFPVKERHLSQISCAQNEYCSWGAHCHKQITNSAKRRFEAETPESHDFPGVISCEPSTVGHGCFIVHRAACAFRKTYYVPDLSYTYEVSSITGHTCGYNLAITHTENATTEHITVKDSAYTSTGIKIMVLGAFNQPDLHITESFVKRVGNQQEAYLVGTSPRNQPRHGTLGEVQANTTYSRHFIFDPLLTTCDFYEDNLRCQDRKDPVTEMMTTKEQALPLSRNLHLFRVEKGQLMSNLLVSAAVRIQLQLSGYRIQVESTVVCPRFSEKQIEVTGCYNCPFLARLTFTAMSTCQKGLVEVSFASITIHTKAVSLQTEESEIVIKFLAHEQCFQEKLCLQAQNQVRCTNIDFCLDEASIELRDLHLNSSKTVSIGQRSSIFNWEFFASIDSVFYMLKFGGALLVFAGLIITIFSTLVSCCCRR